jgi:hypothetical protein
VKYQVTITRTSDGAQEYMQIISADQFSTNIVLIGEFQVNDTRMPEPTAKKSEGPQPVIR